MLDLDQRSDGWKTMKRRSKIITPTRAFELQKHLDVTNLASILLSEESKKLQREGWIFYKVSKDVKEIFSPEDHQILFVFNKWNDRVIFRKF